MRKLLLLLVGMVLVFQACKKEDPLALNVPDVNPVVAPKEGATASFNVLSNADWIAHSNAAWCTLNGKQNLGGNGDLKVNVVVAGNTGYTSREAVITISAPGVTNVYTINVSQQGVNPAFTVSTPAGIAQAGGTTTMVVTANVSWTVAPETASSWYTVSPSSATGSATVTVTAVSNDHPETRRVNLVFTPAQSLPAVTKEVVQLGENPALELSPSSVSVAGAESMVELIVTSNLDYTVTPNVSWIEEVVLPAATGAQPMTVVSKTVKLKILTNNEASQRPGTVSFTAGTVTATFSVSQASVKVEAAADSVALKMLYRLSTSAASWSAAIAWDTTASYKTWRGVTTDGNGRVTKLALGTIGTSAPGSSPVAITETMDFAPLTELTSLTIALRQGAVIPATLASLPKLGYLRVKYCATSGVAAATVPASIYNIANLHYLELSSFSTSSSTSFLSGAISADIHKLNKLDTLILTGNAINALPAEIGQLTNLLVFEMKNNWANISLPNEITSLTALKKLDCNQANINGAIPAQIGNLTNLEYLDFGTNKFSSGGATVTLPASICQLTNLKTLNLSSAKLTGSIPSDIGNLTNLITLNLSNNKETTGSGSATVVTFAGFTGDLPAGIGNLTKLTSLNINKNSLEGVLPGAMGSLQALTSLNIMDNLFTGVAAGYGSLNLASLSFQNNRLTSLTETNFPNATSINFQDNLFTADGFPANITAPKLTSVVLTNNRLSHLPAGVLSIASLTNLTLGGNPYTAVDMANDNLSQLTKLTSLNLSNCPTLTAIPSCMKTAAPSLATLNMDNCAVSSIPADADLFVTIKSLSLQNNNMTVLPDNIKKLPALESITLSNNKLAAFPMALVDTANSNFETTLKNITLSNNLIAGVVPVELSRLNNLNVLMLMGNKLTGTVPFAIFDKTVIFVTFNVMSNQLTGFDFLPTDPDAATKMLKITPAIQYRYFCPQYDSNGSTQLNPCPFTAYGL